MFGAEPQEKWTVAEAAEFDEYAAKRLRRMLVAALWATGVFAATVLAIGPFLYAIRSRSLGNSGKESLTSCDA